jgi:hypothetical protein
MTNPKFYSSNFDKYFTPEEKGWYIQYSTESGDRGAIRVDREPESDQDALQMLLTVNRDECWILDFYAEVL